MLANTRGHTSAGRGRHFKENWCAFVRGRKGNEWWEGQHEYVRAYAHMRTGMGTHTMFVQWLLLL